MNETESTNMMLQQHITSLKRSNEDLIRKCEENEQYGRCLCLRIKGVPRKDKEKSDEVLKEARKLFDEAEVEILDAVLDRAHRISKANNDIIVRFTTFRHRTLFYRQRKKLNGKSVHLDLTKSRLVLLKESKKVVDDYGKVDFCYADINCRCKVKFCNGRELFFNSINDLKNKLEEYEEE